MVSTADTALVVLSRRRVGRPLLLGGTDHLSHRMRRLGLTTGQVAGLLALLAAAGGLAGGLVESRVLPVLPVLVPAALLAAAGGRHLLGIPVYPTAAPVGLPVTAAPEPQPSLRGDPRP
ncbi:hypothetical protein ACFQ1I_09790 [Kitasatospora arboriphila]